MAATKTWRILILSITIPIIVTVSAGNGSANFDILQSNFSNQWIPASLPSRRDLQCDCTDLEQEDEMGRCCTCRATPIWYGNQIYDCLFVELVSVLGKSIIVNEKPLNMSMVYEIIHTGEEISDFPTNICDWDPGSSKRIQALYGPSVTKFQSFWTRIVTINFSHNKITTIPNINCLKNLDTLDLGWNEVEYISNVSFNQLQHFRKLDLQNNRLVTMDIGVFSGQNVHLWFVDLSQNLLSSIDVSNMYSRYPFCDMNFEENHMESLTNLGNFTLLTNTSYGPGMVSFKDNGFETFPNFEELFNLQDLSQLGSLMHFGFDFRNTQFDCNCHMEKYMELAADVARTFWRDYMDVKCASPPHLRGIALVNVSLDELTCDISDDRNCPADCTCVDQPSISTVHVDCSNTGKTELPQTVPESKYSRNYNLDLSGNFISILSHVPYLGNVTSLNLSKNELVGIDEEAAEVLENTTIDISDNNDLRTIPTAMQTRSLCSLQMNNLQVKCDCDTSWISNWVSVKGCNKSMSFICEVPGHGLMPADKFSPELLGCGEDGLNLVTLSAILATLVLVLATSAVILIHFRYEVLIITLRLRRLKKAAISPSFRYDVFLSYDEENENLRRWTNQTLDVFLRNLGYKTFVPCKDLQFGGIRESETIMTLEQTKHFILILSESYCTQEENILIENEWRYGWNMYKGNGAKKIIIINYDHISSFDIDHPQIKAYLRVGENIGFSNHQGDIMDKIVAKIGPPCSIKERHFDNEKQKFNCKIFQIHQKDTDSIQDFDKNSDTSEEKSEAELEEKSTLKDGFQAMPMKDFTAVNSLISEKPRPGQGPFKYYV